MTIVFRIIVGIIVVAIFWYFGEHKGKTIYEKDLTPDEYKYLDNMSFAVYVLTMLCAYLLVAEN